MESGGDDVRAEYRLLGIVAALAMAAGATGGTTLAQFSATTSNSGNSFSAAPSFGTCSTPTPYRLTGFEHGLANTNLFADVQGGVTIDSTMRRSGIYSAKISKTSGLTAYSVITENNEAGIRTNVYSAALLLDSLPAADVASLMSVSAVSSNALRLGYQASTQKLTLRWGNGTPALSSMTVAAGNWYSIELKVDTSVNPRTAEWRVDAVNQASVSSAETPNDQPAFSFGSSQNADVFTAHYDDFFRSKTLADYPVGPVSVRALRPTGMGTHSGANNFQHNDSSAIDATSYTRLDEVPMDSVADFIKQSSASATSYIELTLEDTTETCIKGVQAVVSQHKTINQGNTMKTSVFDGTTERVVYSGDTGSTSVIQKTAVVTPAASSWSQAALNGLVLRMGYATDANPDPRWDSFLLEYAAPYTGLQPYRAEVLSDIPSAYWRLGEASGTTAVDVQGFDNGTYAGGYALAQAGALTSDTNTAVDFNGTSGRVSVPHSWLLDLTSQVSVEAWIKPDTVSGSRVILNKSGGNLYYLYIGDNELFFGVRSAGAYPFIKATGVVTTGAWQHIVGTFNGSTMILYRNGVKVAEQTFAGCPCAIDTATSDVFIGAFDTTQGYFDGGLDEVALYQYTLTPTQVQTHYSRR